MNKFLLPFSCLLILASSCVSSKKFSDLEVLKEYYKMKNDTLDLVQKENATLRGRLNTTTNNLNQTTTQLNTTKASLSDLEGRYDQLNQEFNTLQSNLKDVSSKSKNETQSLQSELNSLKGEHTRMQSIMTAFDRSHQMTNQGALLANDTWSQKLQRMQDLSETIASEAVQIQSLYALLAESANVSSDGIEIIQFRNKLIVRMSADKIFRKNNVVNTKGQSVIKEVAGIVLRNSNLNIEILGHTDDEGSDNGNWTTSVLRAASVAKQMVKNEFPPYRIMAIGRSSHDPINPDKTSAARKLNRRVEIVIKPHAGL